MMVKTADEIRFNLTDGLLKAVQHGQYARVKQLLKRAPIQFLARNGGNLLLHALRVDNDTPRDKIFRHLILKGANIRHVDKNSGKDVLSWAAQLGREQQVKTVLQQTATDIDILRKDRDLQTPLHHAVISGNIKVVQPIAEVCSRYKLNIDICDKHGLTPYIHARKLGYHDIAELLVNIGKASAFMFDGKSFKNADEWAVDGVRERMRKARRQMHKQRMSSKIGGQFVPATQSKRIPTVVVTTSEKKSYVIDLSKSKSFVGHSLKEFDDKMAHGGLRPWEHAADAEAILDTSHGITNPSVTSLIVMNGSSREKQSDELDLPKLDVEKPSDTKERQKSSTQDFNYLMYILSLQSTDTYRLPVKSPEPPVSTVSSPLSEDRDNISSLAILLGKESKSGRTSASPRKSSSRAERTTSRMTPRKHESLLQSKKRVKKNKTKFLPSIEAK